MKAEKIVGKGNESLVLFFSGWGMDSRPFRRIKSDSRDVIVVYDYTDLAFDRQMLEGYTKIYLVAWSMGVWAAARVLGGVPLESAVAVNGTPFPVGDESGIPAAVFEGTLEHLSEEGIRRFNRRMCGTREILASFMSDPVRRPAESLKEELFRIREQLDFPVQSVSWTKAVISDADRIFPERNLKRYWQGVPQLCLDAPHYPFYLWNEWNEIV